MTIHINQCKFCQKEIHGRIDKKFCDSYCRSTFYNKKNKFNNEVIKSINRCLIKNRKILEDFKNQKTVEKEKLLYAGFNFDYITHFEEARKAVTYYVFDMAYQFKTDQIIQIIK